MVNAQSETQPAPAETARPDAPADQVGEGRLPTFFIIGAGRSGTTSMHYVLGQHPQIYMSPNKETNFFAYYCSDWQTPPCTRREDISSIDGRSVKSLEDYRQLFRGVTQETAIGETSPSYLLTAGVPQAMLSFVPDAKIIAVLRQPIEKAYSHLQRKAATGIYPPDIALAAALEQDEARIAREGRGTSFLSHCRYYPRLKPYYDVFRRDRIKICFFEDMEQRAEDFYNDLFRFLEVDPSFRSPDASTRFNQSGKQTGSSALLRLTQISKPLRSRLRQQLPPSVVTRLSRWRHRLMSENIERAPELPAELRRSLTKQYFEDDIRKLEGLIGQDLSRWLA